MLCTTHPVRYANLLAINYSKNTTLNFECIESYSVSAKYGWGSFCAISLMTSSKVFSLKTSRKSYYTTSMDGWETHPSNVNILLISVNCSYNIAYSNGREAKLYVGKLSSL